MSQTNNLIKFSHKIWQKIHNLHLDYVVFLPLFFFIGSQIIIPLPFSPVPVSLQPFTVFLAAWFLGRRGLAGYAMYLLHGACGAPIFAGFSGGLAYLLGPTSGYLIGFLVGAMIITKLKPLAHNSLQIYSLYILATITVFACGVANLSRFMPIQGAVACGLIPFIIGDFVLKPILFVITTTIKNNGR